MNRLFGTKKQAAPVVEVAKVDEKKIDLVEQAQKVENRVNEIDDKIQKMDAEIATLYMKVRNSRGQQRNFAKQRLVQLLKRRKMYGNQANNYMKHQGAIDNIAFTQENITNTMEMATAMKQGYEANQALMKDFDIDKLQDIKDDMQEMMWETEALNDALNYDMDDIDEDDIDDELNDIENDLQLQGLIKNNTNQQNANSNGVNPMFN